MREQALDRRERMMGQRETDLVTAQEELQAWITDLEGVRDQIAGMLNLHSDEDKKIKALMEMVENMRPKQAASVLSEMDLELTVKVVDRMDRAKAGKAMAVMTPKKAAEVAEKLTRPITVGGKP
jgi:flagellar motility protein MotE (MotC chaperone)